MKVDTILDQGSGTINEDNLFVNQGMFGVFDGATSLDACTYSGSLTGGFLASRTARDVFSQNGCSLSNLAKSANLAIASAMESHGVDLRRRESLWSTSAAVAKINDRQLEWIQTGDSFILLIYDGGSFLAPVTRPDHDFETLSLWKSMALTHPAGIREALKNQIQTIRRQMNRSYGVLNGETEAEAFIRTGRESLDGVTDILVFTDGLSIPSSQPSRTRRFDGLVEKYLSCGLQGLTESIRETERQDPECRLFPRFKCHDDIAAIAVQF